MNPAWHAMTAADLDAVLALEVRCYSHPWSRGNFEDSLRAGYLAEVLAAPDGEPRAYVVAMPAADELHLLNLTVAPAWQCQGLARQALERLVVQARGRGASSLWLEVRESNQRARDVYRAAGWAEVGRRRGYYPAVGRREDAVLMTCALAAAALQAEPDRPPPGAGHALV